MTLKSALKSTPILGPVIARLRPSNYVASSADYWEARYRTGGDSGAGSYNRLAEFKAEFVNDFVERYNVQSVIEFGSGDGAQLALAKYPNYIGVDISRTVIDECRRRFGHNPNYTFVHDSDVTPEHICELSLSLDVIYHLVEDEVFDRYMRRLFDAASKAVVIYSSNHNAAHAEHVRHRKFTAWVEKSRPDFNRSQVVKNRYPYDPEDPDNTSFADFYVYFR